MKALVTIALLAMLAPSAHAAPKSKKAPEPPQAPVVVAPPAPPPDPEAWRAKAPAPAAEPKWTPPAASTFTLSNGIPVTFVQNTGLPLVSVRLVVQAGRETYAATPGLGSLTANLLDEGTKSRTGAQIAEEAGALGADLGVSAGGEIAYASLDALAANLDPSLALMADVVLHPRFDKAEVARVKNEVLASIQAAKADPRDAAGRTLAAQVFGAGHPYGTPAIGTEASVTALTAKDLKRYHKTWWHAGNAAFVVSGSISPEALKTALEAHFGGWKVGKAKRAAVAAPSVPVKPRVVFVEQPGAVQSVLRVATPGPARMDAGFMRANVAGTLVAGMFSSRVNMNLREEHGWSYGAFGGFSEARDHGLFTVGTQVQADKTAPAIVEILKELEAARGRAPNSEELDMTRSYLVKSLPGNFETNAATAGSFLAVPQYGAGPDLWAKYIADVNAVDAAASQQAAQTYFATDRMILVVVGPRSVEVDDGKGGKLTVDVVGELKALGYEFVEG